MANPYNDVVKNVTITIGNTITIDPVSVLGIDISYVPYSTGDYTLTNNSGSTVKGFQVTSTKKNVTVDKYTTTSYYVYTLKAINTGSYTFKEKVKYYDNTYSYTNTVTYNFTVVEVNSISIPSTLTLKLGETYTFDPIISQTGATTTLTWSSSNTSVLTVSSTGKITTKGIGTANVKCTATNGVSATCQVTVTPIMVTGISLNKTSANVNCGSTLQLTATVTPSNATNKNVNWKSSNTNVATVNSSGLVTAKTPGQCTITATAADGSGKSASCTVTVKPVLITGITLNQTESELFLGEKLQLTATISPSNATNKALTWSSSNDHVATVNESGMVSSVASGQCIITVSANNDSGKKATCKVTVVNDILSIDDAVAVPSGTMTLPVYMKNESQITGLQFDLQVPDGVTVAESNNQFIANMSDRAVDQSISGTNVSDNLYRFVVFSPTSKAFSGNEGAIAYITLNMDGNMTVGEYDLMLKGIELTKTDGTSIHHKDMTSKLTLTDVKMGDTNGDGTVTVTDAVGIVNTILGRTPSVFISKAADVDGNGSVTISDAVGIINMILNKQ